MFDFNKPKIEITEISEDKKRRCNDAGYSQEKLCGQSHQLITSIL